MIRPSELLSAEALRRYDDTGEPVYTRYERVLLCMRWFGWVRWWRVMDALEIDPEDALEQRRYWKALDYFVKHGKVERRGQPGYIEYRLVPVTKRAPVQVCRRCARDVKDGFVLCAQHLEWDRLRAIRRRAA